MAVLQTKNEELLQNLKDQDREVDQMKDRITTKEKELQNYKQANSNL